MSWNTRPRDLQTLSRGTQWATDRWRATWWVSWLCFQSPGLLPLFHVVCLLGYFCFLRHPNLRASTCLSFGFLFPSTPPSRAPNWVCPLSGHWPSQPFPSTTVREAFLSWCGYGYRLVTMQTSSHCFAYMWSISVSFAFWHCHVLCSHKQPWLRLSYQKGFFSLRSFPFKCCRAMR